MSPPLILHPGAMQGLWRGLRRGRVATVATPLHFWWFGVYFLMGFRAEAWEHKGGVGVAMPGGAPRPFWWSLHSKTPAVPMGEPGTSPAGPRQPG